jgi:hypothetical protein
MARSLVGLLSLALFFCSAFAVVRVMPLGDSVTAGVSVMHKYTKLQLTMSTGMLAASSMAEALSRRPKRGIQIRWHAEITVSLQRSI